MGISTIQNAGVDTNITKLSLSWVGLSCLIDDSTVEDFLMKKQLQLQKYSASWQPLIVAILSLSSKLAIGFSLCRLAWLDWIEDKTHQIPDVGDLHHITKVLDAAVF